MINNNHGKASLLQPNHPPQHPPIFGIASPSALLGALHHPPPHIISGIRS